MILTSAAKISSLTLVSDMSSNENVLIVFLKNPELGMVKTRLAATIGDKKALEIYLKLLHYTFQTIHSVEARIQLYFTDRIDQSFKYDDAFLQEGSDLGIRMKNAFLKCDFNENKKVIIGTDCAQLTTAIIQKAFLQLEKYDLVIGPATDGGYYLLGMKKVYTPLFESIHWSTDSVLDETIQIANHLNLSFYLLRPLTDIDTEEDLWTLPEDF